MTREELFSMFPRPWRLSDDEAGAVLDKTGAEVFQVDTQHVRSDDDVIAVADLIVALVNGTEE
jgi:hypothetical protein